MAEILEIMQRDVDHFIRYPILGGSTGEVCAASNAVSRSLGYAEDGRGALAPRGVSRETQRFRMTADAWRSRPRAAVEIEGLDACRDMFGI